jgi:carboxyl-terminal processing protease
MLGPMVVVALVVGVLLGKGWERTGHATETYEELKTFSEVLTQVQKSYVDETKVKDLVQGAIRGMLSTLDPHSAYMTPEMFKEMQVETKGEFGGVGIQIGVKENRLAVIAPIEGTPAYRAGIKGERRADQRPHVDGCGSEDAWPQGLEDQLDDSAGGHS